MANVIAGLFGSNKQTQQPLTSLRINTSLQGVPIPLLLGGRTRLAGNLIDYFDLHYTNASTASSGGGKGGAVGAGGGKGSSGSYLYFVDLIIGFCEGQASVGSFWINGSLQAGWAGGTLPKSEDQPFGGYVYEADLFPGDYAQTPWSYTEAILPSHAIAYRGLCYGGFFNFPLGSSTALPNFTFEFQSVANAGALAGQPDGHFSIAASLFLTDAHFGLGFPASRLGDLSSWQQYCLALGLVCSPALASAVAASSYLNDFATASNSAFCWQDGLLTVVPYGDASVTAGAVTVITETHVVPANGYAFVYPQITVGFVGTYAGDAGVTYQSGGVLTRVTTYAPTGVAGTGSPGVGQYYESGGNYYFNFGDVNATVLISYDYAAVASYVPNTTPIYDFTLDDFLPNQGSIGQGVAAGNSPVIVVRKPRDQMLNNIQVRYLDRDNTYNPVLIEHKDEASIVAYGRERPSGIKQLDFFCVASAAQQSAVLQLIRQQIARTFQWTVGRHFMLILELMALATVTDSGQGLFEQPVRIIEIQENSDFSITVTAEEYLGTVSAPEYGSQPTSPYEINYNADPGSINAPLIFEPTDELAGGLQIWGAVSGANEATWGGCYVWASFEPTGPFSRVGEIIGPARMGLLTADLPAVAVNPVGATIDQGNTLAVDLTESAGVLSSGTVADAIALNTRCYVGGEIVAYATATLTGTDKYSLTYLVRGAYGTETAIVDHPSGTPFARLDGQIFQLPYAQNQIGQTVYLKFQSFNTYQGGLQNLANVAAYPYLITGSALASPLPNVTNLRTVFDQQTGFTELDWDEVADFRLPKYEIRSGSSSAAAMTLGTVAHPPFRVPGDGEYWVAAVCQPVAGLVVYSENWESVTIAGAIITQNIILTIDLQALNWPGTFTGGAGIDGGLNAIRTGGGNILTDANILTTADILNYGAGSSLSGTYYPLGTFLDIGYVANASVSIKYQPTGVPVGQNVLAIGNILTTPDILGSASTAYIDNYPIIHIATVLGGDLYSLGDLYAYPDLYAASDPTWGAWQKFTPGTYQVRFLDFGFVLSTIDPSTISYDLQFKITITIPARVDTYASTTSNSADTTITFQPTGAASTAAFNGGAGPSGLPAITWGIVNGAAGDDFIITALSLSAISFKIVNGGSRVVRNLNLFAEGY